MTRLFPVSALVAGLALAVAASAQDKGMSEKDCRNGNFPSSEERLVRACDARYALCANPPPAWQQLGQVMRVCEALRREKQLQAAAKPVLPGNLLARPTAPAIAAPAVATPTVPAAAAGAATLSALWRLNGNGHPGDVTVQQAADGTLSGTIYGEPLTGYYAPGERIGVWLRGAPTQPFQAFVGQASADGATFSGRFYGLNASTSGANAQRNVFAFSALRAAPGHPAHPGVPAASAGPASVAGTLALNANNHAGQLVLAQAADGTLSGSVYGDRIGGHYAPGSGSIAFLRYTGSQPVQLYVGTVTAQGISGEFYALTVPAGGSAQRMRYAWSAQMPQVAQPAPLSGSAPAAGPGAQPPFAANSGIAGGTVLASVNEPTAAQCLARCRATAACTAFQFAGGAFGGPGQPPNLPGASCTLFSGATSLRPLPGSTACVMPCDGSAPVARLPGDVLRPGQAPGRFAGAVDLPPRSAGEPSPPPAYIGPLPKQSGTAMLPPAPQPPSPAPAPAPAPPTLSGYAIAVGPLSGVGPGSYGTVTVACPAGKVALSAGYRVLPFNAEPQYGVELRTAVPENATARVVFRNAFAFGPIHVEPYAICVDPLPGMRAIRQGFVARSDTQPDSMLVSCAANERLVGGGFIGGGEAHPVVAAPVRHVSGAHGLVVAAVKTSPVLIGSNTNTVEAVALCAPASAVPDWETAMGAWQTINRRSSASMMLDCPPGKRMLAGGVVHSSYVWREPVQRDPNAPVVFVPAPTFNDFNPLAQLSNMSFPGETRRPNGQPLPGGGLRAMVSNRDIGWAVVRVGLANACATVP